MDNTSPTRQSELFMLRLWPKEQGDGAIAWRGRIQHALTGRTAYFQGCLRWRRFWTTSSRNRLLSGGLRERYKS
jgi:hypothetical protein